MPTYEYACRNCGEHLEAVQSFSDDPLTVCPNCGGELRKVFGSVGIVFKGSGFYKTDSRNSSSKSTKAESPAASSSETAKPETKTDSSSDTKAASTSDSKPAAAAS